MLVRRIWDVSTAWLGTSDKKPRFSLSVYYYSRSIDSLGFSGLASLVWYHREHGPWSCYQGKASIPDSSLKKRALDIEFGAGLLCGPFTLYNGVHWIEHARRSGILFGSAGTDQNSPSCRPRGKEVIFFAVLKIELHENGLIRAEVP